MNKRNKQYEMPEKERILYLKKHKLSISSNFGLIEWYVINESNEIIEAFSSKTGAKSHAAYLKKLIGLNCYWIISKYDYKETITTKKRKQRFK